jgi:subtilase family serine protease
VSRHLLRLAAVAFIAPLATACGGGGSHALPAAPQLPAQSSANTGVPESAMRGVQVVVHLPLRDAPQLDALIASQSDKSSPQYHHFLTPDQFRASYAPAAADLNAAASSLQALGFETRVTSQSVIAAAPQAIVENTFGVHIKQTMTRGRSALSLDRKVSLPAALARANATVTFAQQERRLASKLVDKAPYTTDNRYSTAGPYWFTDLKQAYGYPSYQTATGQGRTIAVVIDSDVLNSDLKLYFEHEHLNPPNLQRRKVDGGPRPASSNDGSTYEASLDVQMSGGSAPDAKIMLYGIPDLYDNHILDAYQAIVDDNKADIVNSSFGLCELYYTAAYNGGQDQTSVLHDFHDVFRQGNAQGITFVSSSGDSGAYDCFDPTSSVMVLGVENPADDPNVTGVGGTNLVTASTAGSRNSSYTRESAFADLGDPAQGAPPNYRWGSGGGISVVFPKPAYQLLVNTHAATRTVPDVSMHMGGCPGGVIQPCNPDDSSVITAVGGSFYLLIGTSASSPEFAGLLAVTEQTLGTRLGNANGYIYTLSALGGSTVYRQDIPGNNGYPTSHGYNYVLGNGTPHAAVFAAQPFSPVAGDPWTPTNP